MLTIEQTRLPSGAALVTVKGRMMLGEDSQQLESAVAGLLNEGIHDVVFDLSGLTHIDSTGIGRFIASYRRVMGVKGSLKMAAPNNTVRSAFRVTRLDTVFPFFESVESAVGK